MPGARQCVAGPLEREHVVYRDREQALSEELDQTAEPDRTDNRAGSRRSRQKIAVSSLRDNDLPRYKPELEILRMLHRSPGSDYRPYLFGNFGSYSGVTASELDHHE